MFKKLLLIKQTIIHIGKLIVVFFSEHLQSVVLNSTFVYTYKIKHVYILALRFLIYFNLNLSRTIINF